MLALVHVGLVWIGLLGGVSGPAAQQEQRSAEKAAQTVPALEKLRERVRALPPEKRARIERCLDEFEKLPPQVRMKLLERAMAFRERERAADVSMSHELRRRLDELDTESARELWISHLRERLREHGREVRERLPEDLRRRLERAPPEARRRFLEALFDEREPVSRKALERMRDRWGLSEEEIQRLERLPLGERLHAMLEMRSSVSAGEGG
jgi:hypothetical protein